MTPDVSIIVVNWNTCELTLACLRSVYAETREVSFELLVVDNASDDGSAAAIAETFPQAVLLPQTENLGFARANNVAAARARGEFLLLLNSDTVVFDQAIDRLVAFARANPEAGIYGGRTFFEDGTLNPSSCWSRSTPWSEYCHAVGLARVFRSSRLFNPESFGSWRRDTVRQVDIVSGCFFLIRRALWEQLGGFSPDFFMYGEEADLCLRAARLGARPLICPEAQIIHYGGKSERTAAGKLVKLLDARRRLIERHWPEFWIGFGRTMQKLGVVQRLTLARLLALGGHKAAAERARTFAEVWRRRREWATPDDAPPANAPASAGTTHE